MFTKKWFKDTLERSAKTFVEAFLILMIASGTLSVDISSAKSAALSAGAAGISVIISALSSLRGDPGSASIVI